MTNDNFVQAVQSIWIEGGSLTDKRIRTLNLLNQFEAETEQLHKHGVMESVCPRCNSNRIAESDEIIGFMDCEWCSLRWQTTP
jgi:hypothetical protein